MQYSGFLNGCNKEEGIIIDDLIYVPHQVVMEDILTLLRDPEEMKLIDAITIGLWMRRVGFVFTQAMGREGKVEYTMSRWEVIPVVELHVEGEIEEWVIAVVKLEVNEDRKADVHFKEFQLSDI